MRGLITCLAATLILVPLSASGAVEWIRGATVVEVLTRSDTIYGNCMIKINKNPSSLSCGSDWFTMSCSGDFGTKADNSRKYDLAVAAYITGRTVKFQVNDAKLHNGFCFIDDFRLAD